MHDSSTALLEPATPDRLITALGQLPPVGQVLARLQHLFTDPSSGLDEVTELVRLDASLSTRVVQISNSIWFRRGQACTTISEALGRIGFRETYRLVAIVAASTFVARPLAAYRRDAISMWQESVSCALAAELLAEALGDDTSIAYLSGLLHAVGRIPINQHIVAGKNAISVFNDESFPNDHSAQETEILGFHQAEVSAIMLERWGFNQATIMALRFQYEPLQVTVPYNRISAILYAARLLRSTVCQRGPIGGLDDEKDIFGSIGLTRDHVLAYVPVLEEKLRRVNQIVMT
jgi:HD-like signal output (HDOD) protein